MVDKVDYWISEVCYRDDHIKSVKIYKDNEVAYGLENTWTVTAVVDTINKGYNINNLFLEFNTFLLLVKYLIIPGIISLL